jgi:CubicO group peptidase (beta-lactamase class C family)
MKTDSVARVRASFLLRLFLIPVLLVATAAHAAAPAAGSASDPAAGVDEIFRWATSTSPGCACAASWNGRLVVSRGYGLADLEQAVPITPETVFDVGSVVKQFVAASVLLLVDDKRIALSDDIRRYIPQLPDYGHTVTVDHLLTHTGGIRDWTGILPLAAAKEDALTLTLRQRGLDFVPGEEWAYSNSGYVLLKEMVARVSGMSFADFTRRRLFEPLGMKSTEYRLDLPAVTKNRALAYEKKGDGWKLDVLVGPERGGGGALFSTAQDLVTWNDALAAGRLGKFVTRKLEEPARLGNGRKLGYARALFLDQDPEAGRIVWHSGSAAAYKSLVGRYTDHGFSVAILCNAGDASGPRTRFANRLLELFVPGATAGSGEPPKAEAGASVAGPDLDRRAGVYFDAAGDPLRLGVQDGSLRIARGPVLVAVTKDRFRAPRPNLEFRSGDDFEISFLSTDELEIESMEGKTTRYRRGSPFAPTAAELDAFAGRYRSDEIGTVILLAPGTTGLVARLEHAPERNLPLQPVDRDAFQVANMTFRFVRDAGGSPVGFDYGNPLIRRVRFTRLGDGMSAQ